MLIAVLYVLPTDGPHQKNVHVQMVNGKMLIKIVLNVLICVKLVQAKKTNVIHVQVLEFKNLPVYVLMVPLKTLAKLVKNVTVNVPLAKLLVINVKLVLLTEFKLELQVVHVLMDNI